jgi:histidyl-tRNA synthetase
VGVEALGFGGPDVDAEVILMCRSLWRDLGLADVRLDINCLGQSSERQAHREALIRHLEAGREQLDAEARRRLHSNPLRILDTKNPALQGLVESAPRLLDFLGEASLKHFDSLCAVLDAAGQPYRINHRLVRGMDYYSLTVFEWVTDRLGAQGTVCGGGRYDGLAELVGGKPAPGIGWGMGIERVLDLLAQSGVQAPAVVPDVYAIVPAAAALPVAMQVAEALRAAGVAVLMHAAGKDAWGSMKSQFKRADASGARHALIFGADELARGEVALKPLRGDPARDAAPAQSTRRLAEVAAWAAELRNA